MSWEDFYRRRDALNAVLELVRRDADVDLAGLGELTDLFGGPAELAAALQYKWSQVLTGLLSVAQADVHNDPSLDRVEAVTNAWRRAAAEWPELRAVLDTSARRYPQALRRQLEAEQRQLALGAGLAEHDEPAAEVTRIGAAFRLLVRNAPARAARRRHHPVGQLLRRLVASV